MRFLISTLCVSGAAAHGRETICKRRGTAYRPADVPNVGDPDAGNLIAYLTVLNSLMRDMRQPQCSKRGFDKHYDERWIRRYQELR